MAKKDSARIFYFLGTITSHVSHALPLYRELGGTFVVTSKRAKVELEKIGVPVVCINNLPYLWQKIGRRPQRNFQYTIIDKHLQNTCEFLDNNADIVLFYELFSINNEFLKMPKKVFLTHGNMLKNYMQMNPVRLDAIKKYDYMAALSPFMKEKFLQAGVDEKKLVDIGVARTDRVIDDQKNKDSIRHDFTKRLSLPSQKPVVLYAPTFWGETSVLDTGIIVAKSISDDYSLLLRLHPQTPPKIVKKYRAIAKTRANVWLMNDLPASESSFSQQLACADVLIADVSSVVLEALLTDIPIIFAARHQIDDTSEEYESIREIAQTSETFHLNSTQDINQTISTAIKHSVDMSLRSAVKSRIWFHPNDSVAAIARFIKTITS